MDKESMLNILFVEDMPTDMELAVSELKKSGIKFTSVRVETEENFQKAIKEFRPDIIISDYSLPVFDGMKALKITLAYDRLLPFIMLTGSMNEETAVECMKAGATDYVIKEHITRLPFAVNEAIKNKLLKKKERDEEELLLRRTQELTIKQEALIQASKNWQTTFDAIDDFVMLISPSNEIIEANKAILKHYKVSRERVFGMKCHELIHCTNENIRECPCPEAISSKKAVSKEYVENGQYFELIIWPVYDEQNNLKAFTHIIKDITDRKKKEEQIRISLNEKEVLLRELFHRSKNNMNLIMSFLILQKTYSSDEKITVIMNDIISRIQSISLVHQKLDQTKYLSKINLNEYIIDLINSIKNFYNINNDRIGFFYDLESFDVMIDTATPLGLVLNEILTNSIKHAFINMDKQCKILISLKKEDDKWIFLEISDNGRGLPVNFDIRNSKTLGMITIFNIIEKQLDGKVEYNSTSNGLTYKLIINKNLYNDRILFSTG